MMLIKSSRSDLPPQTQERNQSMRRKRYQQGSLGQRKHGKIKVWVGQWWEDGGRRSKVLGRCSEITKGDAQTKLAEILEDQNRLAGTLVVTSRTFTSYVTEKFFIWGERQWKRSTLMTTSWRINHYLVGHFGEQQIDMIDREVLQQFLNEKFSSGVARSTVTHLRWDLQAIFKLAKSDGYVQSNPADALYVPRMKHGSEPQQKRRMTEEEVTRALSALDLRERLIVKLAIFGGLRPGEILALQGRGVEECEVRIRQRVYRGVIDTPKTEKSFRTVALSPTVVADLRAWTMLSAPQPEGWLFPSENREKPLGRDNVWRRSIEPKLREVGLEWATFQVMRRTHISLSRKAGVDPKIIADQAGHDLDVSVNTYTVPDMAQKHDAVARLEQHILN
jgi:integrase